MGRGKRQPALWAIIYMIIFVFFCLSGPEHEAAPSVAPLFGSVRVKLSGGLFPQSADKLAVSLEAGDIPMLEYFTALRSADLRGSACYEEIAQWSAGRPEVSVVYSVPLPDGSSVDSTATELDLSGLRHEDAEAAASALSWLPQLQSVELGQVGKGDGGLTLEDMALLSSALPEADFDFSLTLLGQEISPDEKSLDLSSLTHSDAPGAAAVLSCLRGLKELTLGSESTGSHALTWEDIKLLCAACPDAAVDYGFSIYGKDFNLKDEQIDLRGVAISDEGAAARLVLPCMNRCKTLDMDSTGLSNETMAGLRADFPEVEVIWRVWFGENYSVRTDTERILASKPTVGGMVYDASVLQYCTKVKYLDLGHNDELSDMSFAASMPELEVVIIAMTAITDISPLASCPEMEYLEIQSTDISDLEPLSRLTKLAHLNIASCPNISDISPLYGLKKLERLWIGALDPIPAEQIEEIRAALPGCKINLTVTDDPTGEYWRYTRYDPDEPKYYWVERYELIREQLGYNYQDYSFYWLDPLCELEAPAEFAGKYGREVYGLE